MKPTARLRISVIVMVIAVASACRHHREGKLSWPEMNSFHTVMARVYHPYKDSANLKPLKSDVDDLEAAARAWESSELPANVDESEGLKENLTKLRTDTEALAALVETGAGDEALGKSLTALHESFHRILEMTQGEHEDEHKHQ